MLTAIDYLRAGRALAENKNHSSQSGLSQDWSEVFTGFLNSSSISGEGLQFKNLRLQGSREDQKSCFRFHVPHFVKETPFLKIIRFFANALHTSQDRLLLQVVLLATIC